MAEEPIAERKTGEELLRERARLLDLTTDAVLVRDIGPDDWNVYDSLGEAYADHGQTDLAVLNYRRSLALNPRNDGASKVLRKMMVELTKSKLNVHDGS
jgi:tetratricopeptide (TPR) repeat protein